MTEILGNPRSLPSKEIRDTSLEQRFCWEEMESDALICIARGGKGTGWNLGMRSVPRTGGSDLSIETRMPLTDLQFFLKEGRGMYRRSDKDTMSREGGHRGRSQNYKPKSRSLHLNLDEVNRFYRKRWYCWSPIKVS